MNKIKFLLELNEHLAGLPKDDVAERLCFYSEMIEDRMEDGLSEEESVAAVGSVDEIARQITAEIPLSRIVKEKIKPKRRLKAWEIVLLAVGSPIWLSIGISAFAAALSIYVSMWAVIISFWAGFVSVAACSVGSILSSTVFIATGNVPSGIAVFAAALVCAGLSIFMFCGCSAATKGVCKLLKKIAVWTKICFVKKEEAYE